MVKYKITQNPDRLIQTDSLHQNRVGDNFCELYNNHH